MYLVDFRDFLKPQSCLVPEPSEFPPLLYLLLSHFFSNLCLNELPSNMEGFNLGGNHYTTTQELLEILLSQTGLDSLPLDHFTWCLLLLLCLHVSTFRPLFRV